jgi:hypothetical protein
VSSFSFEVDTSPMASTLDRVSSHVDAVTGAVTVMQTAVIHQEKLAAEQVCTNIDQGFYFLIRSQISQKLAKLRSDVDARLMALRQLSVALAGVRRQMEGDYQMIASRYSKLFDALDRSLRSRVFELDQVPADLASRQMPRILKRLRDSGAQYLISGTESLPTGQSAVSLKIKGNTNKVINSIKRSLLDTVQLKQELQSVVLDRQVEARRAYYIPVLVMEADAQRPPGTILNIASAGGQAFQLAGSKEIERKLRDTYGELRWAPASGRDRAYVAAAFENLLAGKHLDPRLQNEISRLHRASEWQSPRGGGA